MIVTEKVQTERFYRYEESQSKADPGIPTHSLSLSIKMWWSTISKAALRKDNEEEKEGMIGLHVVNLSNKEGGKIVALIN